MAAVGGNVTFVDNGKLADLDGLSRFSLPSLASIGAGPASPDPLSLLLQAAERVASHRMERGPPA